MREIAFTITLAGRQVPVTLTDPHPRGDYWQVMIDHRYQGMLIKIAGRWEGHFNRRSWVQGDDIRVLSDIIEGVYPEK